MPSYIHKESHNEIIDASPAGRFFAEPVPTCLRFFANKDEEYRMLLPFVKDGLDRGNRAFHIIEDGRDADHLHRLSEVGIDVAAERVAGSSPSSWGHPALESILSSAG